MENNTTELAYDLRQKYAELVGQHLEEVTRARFLKNYPDYFNSLENLFTITKHKFKKSLPKPGDEYEEVSEEVKKEKKKSDLEKYTKLRKHAIKTSNDYSNVFLGKTSDPAEVALIEKSLRDIEQFLFYVMDKAKMFGGLSSNRGL